jgi:gamma-glutamylaminecyclotransferase
MTVLSRVFVYGSLKRGFRHHDQLQGARFSSTSQLLGHYLVLYEGGYPALVPSTDPGGPTGDPGAPVLGEVYLVDEAHLGRLDAFEECPTLYQRSQVTLRDGSVAFAYLVSKEQGARFPRIDGTWVEGAP